MKPTCFRILVLAVMACTSCERQNEKQDRGKPVPETSDHGKDKKSVLRSDNAESSDHPETVRTREMVSPARLNRMFSEAEAAYGAKDYTTGIAKIKELLAKLPPDSGAPLELLYFHIGLGNLLDKNMPDAEAGFKDCIRRFPKGDYTSRAYLGLGRACMMQEAPAKKNEARVALEKAAEDPKHKAEAELWISELAQLPAGS